MMMIDQLLPPLKNALNTVPFQRKTNATLEEELRIARQQIEYLSARNADLQRQLEELIQKEAAARSDAYHDELTGLPNRRLLNDRMQQALAQAARHWHHVAVLLIDMDDFKAINDLLGHAAGDELLRQVAQRLKTHIRAADTACRYGGDEFVVVLAELDDADAIETVTNKIRTCLDAPYQLCGKDVAVKASIGRAVYPQFGTSYEDLVKQADAAMYRDKTVRKRSCT